jgi:uncharacterized membrane protein YgcG
VNTHAARLVLDRARGIAHTAMNRASPWKRKTMKRRFFAAALCIGLLTAGAANARDLADTIVSQLRSQGYDDVTVTSTWLNRTRIFAQSNDAQREIILNPRTGEILRDLYIGGESGSRIVDDDDNSGRGNSNDDDDDRDDDDGDDHDDNDDGDNSGHGGGGGGNSGSGGGDGGDDD